MLLLLLLLLLLMMLIIMLLYNVAVTVQYSTHTSDTVIDGVNPLKAQMSTGYTWPSRSNLHFYFLILGHPGAQG